jgi:hypothetical protein
MKEDPDWTLSDCDPRRDPATHDVISWEAVISVVASLALIAYLAGMIWIVWFNKD